MKLSLILLASVAFAAAAPASNYPSSYSTHAAPAHYTFDYAVKDDYTYVDMGQYENRNGDAVKGNYHVVLPDGRKQTVDYHVDGYSGYVADVKYDGYAKDAEYSSKPAAYKPTTYSKAAPAPIYKEEYKTAEYPEYKPVYKQPVYKAPIYKEEYQQKPAYKEEYEAAPVYKKEYQPTPYTKKSKPVTYSTAAYKQPSYVTEYSKPTSYYYTPSTTEYVPTEEYSSKSSYTVPEHKPRVYQQYEKESKTAAVHYQPEKIVDSYAVESELSHHEVEVEEVHPAAKFDTIFRGDTTKSG